MTGNDKKPAPTDAVETLLGQAAPRPLPPAEDEQLVRAAVKAEWRAMTRRRRRQRFAVFGLAATVLVAIGAALTIGPGTVPPSVAFATLDKSRGSIVLQSDRSQRLADGQSRSIFIGETLRTEPGAAVGLKLASGGSLRVDENTRIEFLDVAEIALHKGRVYVDSSPTGPSGTLKIRTRHGVVTPVGTQYMTAFNDNGLTVAVREGEVRIDSGGHDHAAAKGQQLTLSDSSAASVRMITGAGAQWQWIEAVAPAFDADGKSAYAFLAWVGRETGHRVEYASVRAEELARETRLVGTIDGDPRSELRLRMMTADLAARFDADRAALVITKTE